MEDSKTLAKRQKQILYGEFALLIWISLSQNHFNLLNLMGTVCTPRVHRTFHCLSPIQVSNNYVLNYKFSKVGIGVVNLFGFVNYTSIYRNRVEYHKQIKLIKFIFRLLNYRCRTWFLIESQTWHVKNKLKVWSEKEAG